MRIEKNGKSTAKVEQKSKQNDNAEVPVYTVKPGDTITKLVKMFNLMLINAEK